MHHIAALAHGAIRISTTIISVMMGAYREDIVYPKRGEYISPIAHIVMHRLLNKGMI